MQKTNLKYGKWMMNKLSLLTSVSNVLQSVIDVNHRLYMWKKKNYM